MNERATIRPLSDGRRLHLNDGPIDLVIEANGAAGDIHQAYEAAAGRFVTILDELCAELPLLRSRVTQDSACSHRTDRALHVQCCLSVSQSLFHYPHGGRGGSRRRSRTGRND